MGCGGKREGGSGWGTHVHPRLIHVTVWQKPPQYYTVLKLQLKKNKAGERRREEAEEQPTAGRQHCGACCLSPASDSRCTERDSVSPLPLPHPRLSLGGVLPQEASLGASSLVRCQGILLRCCRSVASDSLRPHGCSPPGSCVHGILQAGVLEWVAMPIYPDCSKNDVQPP